MEVQLLQLACIRETIELVLVKVDFDLFPEQVEEEKRDQRPGKRPHLAEEEEQASFKNKSRSELLKPSSDSGIIPFTRHAASAAGTVHPERASSFAVSHSGHKNDFMKPKGKVSANDATVSAEQTSMRRPGLYIFPLHVDILFYNKGQILFLSSYSFFAASFTGKSAKVLVRYLDA